MLDPKALAVVIQLAKLEQWPDRRTFTALLEAGIDTYIFHVARREGRYFASEALAFRQTPMVPLSDLEVARRLDVAAVKAIVRALPLDWTADEAFHAALASAGVSRYRVDLTARTVTYHGLTDGQHVAKLARWKAPKAAVDPKAAVAPNSSKASEATPEPPAAPDLATASGLSALPELSSEPDQPES